jgi:hypothetical protein
MRDEDVSCAVAEDEAVWSESRSLDLTFSFSFSCFAALTLALERIPLFSTEDTEAGEVWGNSCWNVGLDNKLVLLMASG